MSSNCSPLVSVVMPVFNGEKYLAEAIESILTQTFADFELLIVDDASEDGSADIIRDFQNRDARIRSIKLAENVGIASARNKGNAVANGEYIAAMDCDDVSMPERLEKQVDFMQSNPRIGLLGTCARTVNADLTSYRDFEVPLQHALITINIYFRPRFVHSSTMIRREYMIAVGGYAPGRRVADDLELQTRLLAKTHIRFANLPDALLLFRRHAKSTSQMLDDRAAAKGGQEPRERLLRYLWNEAPESTLDRFNRMRRGVKLGLVERRLARRDLQRLIEAFIARNCVDPSDETLLVDTMNRLLEQTTPRLWQMFCHWRRYNFGR